MTPGDFVGLNLSNVGNLEEQFQLILSQVAEVFEQAHEYESNKDDVTSCQVQLEVNISRQLGEMIISMDTRARLKAPKRKRVGRSGFYSAGKFTVAAVRQADMFPPERSRVRALHPAAEQGDSSK